AAVRLHFHNRTSLPLRRIGGRHADLVAGAGVLGIARRAPTPVRLTRIAETLTLGFVPPPAAHASYPPNVGKSVRAGRRRLRSAAISGRIHATQSEGGLHLMNITVGKAAIAEASEKLKNWGRWGKDDQIGTLNHIQPEDIIKAASLI